ncbi:MAG: glycogen debranching enzyme GlgX [Microbacteriaceae bacterium]|nr:MAG: glycogen debranching enzyme GlgX [Microbacteriaceae bacterium]
MTSADAWSALGATLTTDGCSVSVWSHSADAIELCVFATGDPTWVTETIPMTRGAGDVWTAHSDALRAGMRYALRASGPDTPQNAFDREKFLLDPYARGLARAGSGGWRAVPVDESFDWGNSAKPNTPLDDTVIYEAHVKGISKLNPAVPSELRGSYAGLAHPATIEHLLGLGVTAVELLPVHAFVSEERLVKQGLSNYWGYNTLNFFTPHAAYATAAAQAAGSAAVLREFKGMVKLLHGAGLEVILDVVYNHTSEEGPGGPTSSFRGLDNSAYYRQDQHGNYIDVTGCGNAMNASHPIVRRLIDDSLRYWANDVQIDGFRFDLAVTLGRDEHAEYSRDHPLLYGILDDPHLHDVKKIAEPWDVGEGGWQTGNFPDGWSEWNDQFRDRTRTFWLRDIADARSHGEPSSGIGPLATEIAGSADTFAAERGPLASVNFITAHDGFTVADLVAYDSKHNIGNGEDNRDGTNDNRSFNHGVEGGTTDPAILAARRKAIRNLMATLVLSAGLPMITAGDEFGRSQSGNNNAYCHDDELTWLDWEWDQSQRDLLATVSLLIRLRRENPGLRPVRYGKSGEDVPNAARMDWYDASGGTMSLTDWQSPENRTLQYLAANTDEFARSGRTLLIVHGLETSVPVTLPTQDGVAGYTLLWDSTADSPPHCADQEPSHSPGSVVTLSPASIQLYRVDE